VVQARHIAPPLPHAVALVPPWQLDLGVLAQQPGHVVESHRHVPASQ
jgi:hypothetical protein